MFLLRPKSLLLLRQSQSIRFVATGLRMPPLDFKKADDTSSDPSEGAPSIEMAAAQTGRPMSPHITIYEPQLTWIMSIGHRVTGAGLAAGIYAFGLYYAVAVPEAITATAANFIANDLPSAVVFAGKYTVAAPFIFHSLNGIRHLVSPAELYLIVLTLEVGLGHGWLVNIGTLVGATLLSLMGTI